MFCAHRTNSFLSMLTLLSAITLHNCCLQPASADDATGVITNGDFNVKSSAGGASPETGMTLLKVVIGADGTATSSDRDADAASGDIALDHIIEWHTSWGLSTDSLRIGVAIESPGETQDGIVSFDQLVIEVDGVRLALEERMRMAMSSSTMLVMVEANDVTLAASEQSAYSDSFSIEASVVAAPGTVVTFYLPSGFIPRIRAKAQQGGAGSSVLASEMQPTPDGVNGGQLFGRPVRIGQRGRATGFGSTARPVMFDSNFGSDILLPGKNVPSDSDDEPSIAPPTNEEPPGSNDGPDNDFVEPIDPVLPPVGGGIVPPAGDAGPMPGMPPLPGNGGGAVGPVVPPGGGGGSGPQVPEPSSLLLIAMGGLMLMRVQREVGRGS